MRRRGNRGIITVFVTLMMVPVVAISGVMVDVARLKLYSSQAVMAADSYGNAVLSEYDNLLKELYGLFSVTQNEEGLAAIEELADYTSLSFDPTGDGLSASGFMPYRDAKMEVSYEPVEGASLSNNNVLMTQISDFMRYRIVEEVLDEAGILNTLGKFGDTSADMDAMEERADITDSSAKALGKIDEYYEELKKLDAYPDYLSGRQDAFEEFSAALTEIAASEEYEDYVYYLEHREEIEEAIRAVEEDDGEDEDDEDMAEMVELYERFADFDPDEYREELDRELEPLADRAADNESEPIDFDNTDSAIDALEKKAKELDKVLTTLDEQVKSLRAKLGNCSEDVKKGIEEEIKELEGILNIAGDFKETWRLIEEEHACKDLNRGNKELMEEETPKLNQAMENLLTGNVQPGDSYWPRTVPLAWYDFKEDKGDFYRELKSLCETGDDGDGDRHAGEKEIDRAENVQKEAEESIGEDEETDARDISPGLAAQLGTNGSSGKVPGFSDYFSGGLSFDAVAGAGGHVLDRFLVASYDFGMFSSRVSGIEPKEEKSGGAGNAPGTESPGAGKPGGTDTDGRKYADYSLTGVEMSGDVNYLYGAELEYLLGGYSRSVSNLNNTRNIICGVRMTMNFASTYRIREINTAISNIANAAAASVSASGVGAAAAPLVRVAVSGALRLAVASLETAADWNCLKNRESVVLFKTDVGELKAADGLASLLGIDLSSSGGGKKNSIELSYEDYLYVLICLFLDDNTLLRRTSDLITLNVNQAENGGDELTELDFKMEDTVTAVKAACKVKADFAVLPDYIAKMYYSKTQTETLIETLEGTYFGYSVIRGY